MVWAWPGAGEERRRRSAAAAASRTARSSGARRVTLFATGGGGGGNGLNSYHGHCLCHLAFGFMDSCRTAKRRGGASEVGRPGAQRSEAAQLRAVVPGPLANLVERQAKLSPHIGHVGSHVTKAVCSYCVFQPLFRMYSCVVSANSLESGRNGPEPPKRNTAAGLAPVTQVLRRAAARNEGET